MDEENKTIYNTEEPETEATPPQPPLMTEEIITGDNVEEAEMTVIPQQPPQKENRGFEYMLRDVLSVVISAVVIAMLLKAFVVDSRIVPTNSMYPTIEGGDRVIMLKFPYYFGFLPERQDVVVFAAGEEFDSEEDLLKRVIGLPGDIVEVKGGNVFVNGEAITEPYIYEPPVYRYDAVTVPEECYFMLGDNRNRSRDSHMWNNPFVPFSDIKGKVVLCYWPLPHLGLVK